MTKTNDTVPDTDSQSSAGPRAAGFAPRTYRGGCICGAVRYEAVIDFSAGTSRCNCSICTKASLWSAFVRPDAFKLLTGDDSLFDFQRGPKFNHYPFCKHCGVRSFGYGDAPWLGGAYYAVHVNCLELEDDELAGVEVRHFDGRHDRWESSWVERLAHDGPAAGGVLATDRRRDAST